MKIQYKIKLKTKPISIKWKQDRVNGQQKIIKITINRNIRKQLIFESNYKRKQLLKQFQKRNSNKSPITRTTIPLWIQISKSLWFHPEINKRLAGKRENKKKIDEWVQLKNGKNIKIIIKNATINDK
jgi:hypothetical protein